MYKKNIGFLLHTLKYLERIEAVSNWKNIGFRLKICKSRKHAYRNKHLAEIKYWKNRFSK